MRETHEIDRGKGMGVLVISSCTNSLGGLNNRNLYLTFLEAGKSKVMVLVNLVPGKIDPLRKLDKWY